VYKGKSTKIKSSFIFTFLKETLPLPVQTGFLKNQSSPQLLQAKLFKV
jgi:hypothetical protein